jgi:hypothetical protein
MIAGSIGHSAVGSGGGRVAGAVGVGAENPVTSSDLHIFVDDAAEPVSSLRPESRPGTWRSGARGAGADAVIGEVGARCEVGPGRGPGLSTGPFPRTASRTRRATFTATGSP